MVDSSNDDLIELRFVGGEIRPQDVRAGELGDLLRAAEVLVQSTVLSEHHELTRDDIFLALTEVQNGSVALYFVPSIPSIVLPEFEQLANRVNERRFDQLPSESHEALRKIATFTRKYRCKAELRTPKVDVALASVEADFVIPVAPRVYMETTIYGRVIEAGGKKPNAHIEVLDGRKVLCEGTREQVKELAERLYELVGIRGTARCDMVTLEFSDFRIQEILPFKETSIVEAMHELAAVAAPYFDGVDVVEYVRSVRDDRLEDW